MRAAFSRRATALVLFKVALATLLVMLVGVRALAAEGGDEGQAPNPKPSRGTTTNMKVANFDEALSTALARRGGAARVTCDGRDPVARRILNEYGAVFFAAGGATPPPVCIFGGAEEVDSFQRAAKVSAQEMGGAVIELQPAAMRALLAARAEAQVEGLDITPRDGSESARRGYADTVRLWNSRLLPALEYWRGQGRLTGEEAERVRRLPVREQVGAVLELERAGVYFSKDFSKSILYSVAAPGASQHLSLLAFDAAEYADARVRQVLARHGWFRTVRNDCPHFTYLGLPESRLPAHGLKRIDTRDGEFWVPNSVDADTTPELARKAW
ncbi:MAG: hypothetical protein JOZ96_14430 [Acidobacteria bacterium]|nr:hypothetical protein [Acidobacteriota bacterium]